MRRILILGLVGVLLAQPVLADQIDTSGLTASQIATLQAQAAQAKAANTDHQNTPFSPSSLSEYAKLGRDIGVGLASTAREIGVATNDFAKTPIGHVATLLIVYKLIGRDIVHYIGGIIWFSIMLPLWIVFFRRMYLYESIETKFDRETGKKMSIIRTPMEASDEYVAGGRIVMAVILAALCAVGFFVTFSGN
jgi:hypothetical protein